MPVVLRITALVAATTLALSAQSLVESVNIKDGTMFSDQVARQVGDLVTIRISEVMSASDSRTSETSRENTIDTRVTTFPESARLAAGSGSTVGTLPAFRATSEKEFTGEGSYSNNGRVSATITGRVVDVLDNGNLVVEGRRNIVLGDNTKTILITGIARAGDIDAGNAVRSERLHNFSVAIEGEGPLSRAEREGILSRLIDILWPL